MTYKWLVALSMLIALSATGSLARALGIFGLSNESASAWGLGALALSLAACALAGWIACCVAASQARR